MKNILILFFPFYLLASSISVQILGSGGPEDGSRASASYLIKRDSKALILVDFGGGAFLRFGQAEAKIEDLEAILISHLHIDHVVDLPALMKAGYFSNRTRPLPVFGPNENRYFPGLNEFVTIQFGQHGAYRYMSDILSSQSDSFSIIPQEIASQKELLIQGIKITAIPQHHGIVPALAYKIEIEGKSIVFSGDTNAQSDRLQTIAKDVDLLIAHHAILQESLSAARELHMTPERIAQVASAANPKILVLSHRMKRTYGSEEKSTTKIQEGYNGKLIWAEDLMEITLP